MKRLNSTQSDAVAYGTIESTLTGHSLEVGVTFRLVEFEDFEFELADRQTLRIRTRANVAEYLWAWQLRKFRSHGWQLWYFDNNDSTPNTPGHFNWVPASGYFGQSTPLSKCVPEAIDFIRQQEVIQTLDPGSEQRARAVKNAEEHLAFRARFEAHRKMVKDAQAAIANKTNRGWRELGPKDKGT